jgi:hypothetical protein
MSESDRRRRDYDAAFPLPMPGLLCDLEMGIGGVHLPDEFFAASPAIQIEVITDWQRSLAELRMRALATLFRTLAAALGDCPEAEKMERFLATCQSLEIECPADMAAVLARYPQGS